MSNRTTFLQSVSFRVDQRVFWVFAIKSGVRRQGNCFVPNFVPISSHVCVCMHAYVYVHMCGWGCTWRSEVNFSCHIPQMCSPYFCDMLVLWPGACPVGKGVYQRTSGTFLFLLPQGWNSNYVTQGLAFFFRWALGIELRSSCSQGMLFHSAISLTPYFFPKTSWKSPELWPWDVHIQNMAILDSLIAQV